MFMGHKHILNAYIFKAKRTSARRFGYLRVFHAGFFATWRCERCRSVEPEPRGGFAGATSCWLALEVKSHVFTASSTMRAPAWDWRCRAGTPGDLVIGDADGVIVVEREKVETLLQAAAKKVEDEAARIEAIKNGNTAAKWLNSALRNASVLKENETL